MATPDEALDLKRRARRRLIGAIALVLFLVVVPPWIMDLEPKPVETSLHVEIPKPDDRSLPTQPDAIKPIAPAVPAVETAPGESSGPDDAGSTDAAKAPPVEPVAKPAAQPPVKDAGKSAPPAAATAPTSPTKTSYIVPVATLSAKGNVKELQAKVGLAGIETYTEPVKTGTAQHTRVRAGPFETKEAAEQARERLRGMGLKPGNVTTR